MATKFMCVGGPLDRTEGTYAELLKKMPNLFYQYTSYNCAGRIYRTKLAQKKAEKAGEVIPPSAIFVWREAFRK